MVTHMKTTIDIADALLEASRRLAERDHITLRELVQEGLRKVLDERGQDRRPFTLRTVTFGGGGLQPEFADADWPRVARRRSWSANR